MRLFALKRHWDRLGRRDAQWAVLTHPDKRHARWTIEEFFRSGSEEIDAVLARTDALGIAVSRRRALDFGCGAGRLTQALAARFDRADGVDIAASMLDEARRHTRSTAHAFYHLNVAGDLSLFENGAFTFVYSTLVLQHMEPRYSRGYIAEFLRVLAPGGALVFQVPSRRIMVADGAVRDGTRTAVPGPIADEACRARITTRELALHLQAGDQHTLHVTVENLSASTWPSLPDATGRFRINLANHWLHEDGVMLQRDDARAELPRDAGPGERLDLILYVTAPQHDGTYWLELDLVQENVDWFAERGSRTLRVRCDVTGGLPPVIRTHTPVTPPPRTAATIPFRERHSFAFGVLRAAGLRSAYWTWRRGMDAVRRRRDRTINWWAGVSFAPRMEMHCVPRAEVAAIVESNGARLIAVDTEMTTGGYESCRYWVVKT